MQGAFQHLERAPQGRMTRPLPHLPRRVSDPPAPVSLLPASAPSEPAGFARRPGTRIGDARPAPPVRVEARKPQETPRSVELQVRNARVTDVDGITALHPVSRGVASADGAVDADLLRPLVYLPTATIVVALSGRQVVGA